MEKFLWTATKTLLVLVVALFTLLAVADEIPANKEVGALTLYCMTEADAVTTAKALVEEDEATFNEKQKPGICHFHPSRFTAKKVLHTITKGDKTLYVMEVESGGDTFYLVTPHTLVVVKSGTSV